MSYRATLHLKKLDDFAAFMEISGWTRVDTKGEYEVLRLTHPDCAPLVFYAKAEAKEHATIQRGHERHVRSYLREKRRARQGGSEG